MDEESIADEWSVIDQTWKKMQHELYLNEYREGVFEGKDEGFQNGFKEGLPFGFESGFLMGVHNGTNRILEFYDKGTTEKNEQFENAKDGMCFMCANNNSEMENVYPDIKTIKENQIKVIHNSFKDN